ncbi:MAG: NAD(P)-dependent oxidoreductase, partial [Acidimicrobiia bacterium]|nr:NAD(P)-dependent oxidoreductase [Acidimicrobiia bacterium]
MQGKNVVVTGAGCLGASVVKRCLEEGASVTVVDVSEANLEALGDGARAIRADVTDPDAMKKAVAGADIVIHTAAALDGEAELQEKVNVVGTRTVAEAAAEAGVERLVH